MPDSPGPLHKLALASRRLTTITAQRLGRRLPPGKQPLLSDEEFRAGVGGAIGKAGAGAITSTHFITLPGNVPPWHDTGIDVAAGERFTWLASGRVYLSRLADIFAEPHFQLWGRIGEGPIFSGTRATHTFTAETAGRLYLASYFPGEWADASGKLATPESEYRNVSGGLSVALIRWAADPLSGLRAIVASGTSHPLVELEIDRLQSPAAPPTGWRELWYLGRSEIYSDAGGSGPDHEIHCCTRCDVSILQREADLPLLPDTTLAWSWRVDALPSAFAEDILLTHDYLSIAVEFDNGIDITYYWSAELPIGTGYWCPLPTWKDREYHVVLRTGPGSLGRWFDEKRSLHADYQNYIGAPPARIRKVWLIANSLFQRREGRCAYRGIRLASSQGECAIS